MAAHTQKFFHVYFILDGEMNVVIDKKKITLSNDIKAFGTFDFTVKLHNGVVASMKVQVSEQ